MTRITMAEETARMLEESKRRAEEVYQKGKELYDKKDYSQAYPLILESAELNHIDAQFNLGAMYVEGSGVSQDDSEAARWFRRAAEQGHVDAQTRLEECLKKQNPIKYWFNRLFS